MKIDGGCHCAWITYEAEVDPANVMICHCTDCQTLSGSSYRVVVPALGGSFKFLTGTPRIYVKTAASGTGRAQAFCPHCGTSIYSGPVGDADGFVGIRVGSIRQRDRLVPQKQYWCESAQGWVDDLSSIPKVGPQ